MSSSQSINFSLITVHYRTPQKVRKLCESLHKFPPSVHWELIIVDNNSGCEIFTKLQRDLDGVKNVHLIGLSENMGFGCGNQEGVRFTSGEVITFINPDIEVQKGTLDTLREVLLSDKNIGIVTPVLESHSGKPLANTWAFPSPWSLLKKRITKQRPQKPTSKTSFSVEWAQGSFLMMRRSLFEKLGGFDDRFFLFLEDTDLCRRCWDMGFRVVQVPNAHAVHEEKRLSGEGLLTSMQKKTFWIHVSSALKYFWKWRHHKNPKIF